MRMSVLKNLSILSVSLLFAAGLLACEKKTAVEKIQDAVNPQGPMEKAGEKIDESVDKTKEAIKN
jgi:predicted DNA-binding transcriptional regulator